MERQELIRKIEALSPERLAEVGEFLDSITHREHGPDRTARDRVLADYAKQYAGTAADLDSDLEAASVEYLLQKISQP
jgi:hypothetical protein